MTKKELELARKRFKFADEAEKNQRQREREDLGFYEGETQWDSDIKTLRAGTASTSSGMPAVPARPCLTINKVRDPIRRIQNDELQADLGMSLIPADDFGGNIDENEIELREGLARRIQRQSNAKDARMWAANRAAISGTGWYGITTKYVDADSFDQEIAYEFFYDQFSVLASPHEQPDGSDIEYAFQGTDMPWDVYREEYPNIADGAENPLADSTINDSEWRAYADDAPGWIQQDGENRSVRVTRYWRYKRERYDIVKLDDGSVLRAELLPKEILKTIPDDRRRTRVTKTVLWALIDGVNTLDEGEWAGKYIPLVKVVGEQMHAFDKERRYEGLVRPARDPQKAYNAMVSSAVETIALAPKSPWLASVRSIENFDQQWKEQAVRNWPVMFYNDVDLDTQQPIAPPQRQSVEPPIQAMALMLGAFDQGIMATIGQANLSDTHPDVRSGAMASTIIEEAARGTSNYLANLIRSVHYEGMIVNDLLYPIYGIRPGRIVSMMNGSQKTQRVMIRMPFVPAQNPNAMPQPHDPMNNPEHANIQPQVYQLTKDGSFNVAISAERFYETKREERLALMAGLIEKNPAATLPIMGDLFFDALGDSEMAKRYKAVLAPPIQQMLQEGQPVDPRLQEAMAHGQALAQEHVQLLADKHARIEQAKIKAMTDAATTDKDNQTKLQIAELDAETKLTIADLKASQQAQADAMNGMAEQFRTMVQLLNEQRLTREQRVHERETLHHTQAHELGMAMVDHQHAKDAIAHEADAMPSPNGTGE